MAFRDASVGADTKAYESIFRSIGQMPSASLALENPSVSAPIYILLCRICYCISKEPHTITLVTSIIVNIELFLFIRFFAASKLMTLYLWQVLFYFSFSMNGNRQTIALALMLSALSLLYKKKRRFRAWALMALSVGIHASMLTMSLLPVESWMFRKIKRKRTIFFLALCLGPLAHYCMIFAAGLIVRLIPQYAHYMSGDLSIVGHTGKGRIRYLYIFFLCLIFLWCCQKKRPDERNEFIYHAYPALTTMLAFGVLNNESQIVSRVLLNYMSSLTLLLPDLFSRLKGAKRQLIQGAVMTLLFLYYLISLWENQSNVVPYALYH